MKHEKWVSKVGPSWEPKIQSLARQPENWRQSLAVIQILCHRLFVVSELILGVSFHGVKVSQHDQQYKQSQHRPGGRRPVVRSFDCVQQGQNGVEDQHAGKDGGQLEVLPNDGNDAEEREGTGYHRKDHQDNDYDILLGREGLKWVNDLQLYKESHVPWVGASMLGILFSGPLWPV